MVEETATAKPISQKTEPATALSWALVIPTFKRPDVLKRCLELAITQTRTPAEVIVVDGSPDWDKTRDRVMKEVAPLLPGVRWVYEAAEVLSASAQRNQGAKHATADVLFMVDDDTWMYPDAADTVMRVYEADRASVIAGVMPLLTAAQPRDAAATSATTIPTVGNAERKPDSRFAGMAAKLNALNTLLKGPMLPESLDRKTTEKLPPLPMTANQVPALHGCRMTFRRDVALRFPFDQYMQYLHEETEMCLRAREAGAMVQIHKPLMFHANAVGRVAARRGEEYRRRWLLSHAYMVRKLLGRSAETRRFIRQYNRRMKFADLALGLLKRDLGLWKGARSSWRGINRIADADDASLVATYREALAIAKEQT